MICPKCRRSLRQIGIDYDKTGVIMTCGNCGVLSPDPVIGFSCLDCGARTDGLVAVKRDVFKYAVTLEGTALLRRGTARYATDRQQSRMPLPEAIQSELARGGPVAALLELRYRAQRRIVEQRGDITFESMRRLFLANLIHAVGGDSMLASGAETDHLLLRTASSADLAKLGPPLLEACQEVLVEGLEPELCWLKVPITADPE